jgi:hypothetical protein
MGKLGDEELRDILGALGQSTTGATAVLVLIRRLRVKIGLKSWG